jgi:hypothetical protein
MVQFVVFHPDDFAHAQILGGLLKIHSTCLEQAYIMALTGQFSRQRYTCGAATNDADVRFQKFGRFGIVQVDNHVNNLPSPGCK